jgi:hypothetical protein
MMETFTEAYDKAMDCAKSYKFGADWHQYLTDNVCIKMLFGSRDGPDVSRGPGLDKFRQKMKQSRGEDEGTTLLKAAGLTPSDTKPLTAQQADAIATLKLMRHLYLQAQQGAQSVWIFAQPETYQKWIYDEISGKSASTAKDILNKLDEVYPLQTRKNMSDGVNQALTWAQKCVAKLGSPDGATKAMVERWFDPGDKMDKAVGILLAGMKKVSNLLQSNKLIFSDEPIDRNSGGWPDYAFVDPGERLEVVYIQDATLQAWGTSDQKWMATLAILHEFSHRVINTDDAVYDIAVAKGKNVGGLKPGGILTTRHAINNADSWAYFVTDLNGQLSSDRRTRVYQVPKVFDPAYNPAAAPAF